MPVTPKQTRVLRDRFGDIAANEIVEVLNNVESISLTEIRALNEANMTRLESKIDARFAELELRLDLRFGGFESKLDAKMDSKMKLGFAEYEAKMAERFLDHTRWMLGAWTTIFLAILGLWFRK